MIEFRVILKKNGFKAENKGNLIHLLLMYNIPKLYQTHNSFEYDDLFNNMLQHKASSIVPQYNRKWIQKYEDVLDYIITV